LVLCKNWPKQPWWITKGNKNHTNSVQLLLLKVVLNTINQPNGISAFRWSSVCISFCNSPRFLGSIINSYCLKFQISSYQNCDWMKSQISSFQNSDWLKFQISSSPQNSDWLKFQISSLPIGSYVKIYIHVLSLTNSYNVTFSTLVCGFWEEEITSEKIAYMYTFKIMFDTSVIQ
jgi:hypothetical protein